MNTRTRQLIDAIVGIRGADNCSPPPAVGIHLDVPFDVYLSWPCASSSDIKAFEISPATWIQRQVSGFTATSDMDVGSGSDTMWLEGPARYAEDFQHVETKSRKTKAYKEAAEATDKTCLTEPEVDRITGIVAALGLDEGAMALRSCLHSQVSIVWIDEATGMPCKARPDLAGIVSEDCARVVNAIMGPEVLPLVPGEELIVDLKTTFDNSREAFRRTMHQLRYAYQAGHYTSGARHVTGRTPRWMWITAKNKAEFGVEVYDMPDQAVAFGERKVAGILDALADCLTTNNFPASSGRITTLDLPPWAYRESA